MCHKTSQWCCWSVTIETICSECSAIQNFGDCIYMVGYMYEFDVNPDQPQHTFSKNVESVSNKIR
jgi:hypothetical protein